MFSLSVFLSWLHSLAQPSVFHRVKEHARTRKALRRKLKIKIAFTRVYFGFRGRKYWLNELCDVMLNMCEMRSQRGFFFFRWQWKRHQHNRYKGSGDAISKYPCRLKSTRWMWEIELRMHFMDGVLCCVAERYFSALWSLAAACECYRQHMCRSKSNRKRCEPN